MLVEPLFMVYTRVSDIWLLPLVYWTCYPLGMSEPRVAGVQVLYVDKHGPYPKLLGAERCWDAERGAENYFGHEPVVVHPPCGPWGCLRHLYRGNEHECAPYAATMVQALGGVLEHPANSKLWPHCKLPKPGDPPDQYGGYTVAVEQVAWGHPCRKPTWLYIVGLDRAVVESEIRTGGTVTHWVGGSRGRGRGANGHKRGLIPAGIKAASAEIRRRTPPAFAEWLVSIAARCKR